jgi:TonB family protein
LRLAEEYLARGDVKEALSIYRMISDTDPSNLSVKNRLGDLLMLANQESEAARVLTDLARCNIRQGHRSEAVSVLNRVLEINSSDPGIQADLGELCSTCGMNAEAHGLYMSAGDILLDRGETAKAAAAYQSAAAVRPENAELQMKLGSACHSLGRLEDSYRAFMRAADGFKRQGDDRAALDAYGRAVKAALSGAESSSSVPEFLTESRTSRTAGTVGLRHLAALPTRPLVLERAVPSGQEAAQRVERRSPGMMPEAADAIVGSIATGEVLFGLGRYEEAVALMKNLAKEHPKDPRIHRKLSDMYLRSDEPAASARAFRELAGVYLEAGNGEFFVDCMANALKLSAASQSSSLTSGSNGAPDSEAATGIGATTGTALLAAAGSAANSLGHRLEPVVVKIRGAGWARYWPAIGLVALLGMAGGYIVIRGGQWRNDRTPPTSVVEPSYAKADEAPSAPPEAQSEPSEDSAGSGEGQTQASTTRESVQRQPQNATQPRSPVTAPEATPDPQAQEKPKPTPPTVGSVGVFASAGGAGQNAAPGTLSTEIPPPPAPPTPRPAVRKPAVMAGGEVVRRVQPSYPAAARSAHITGTVVVDLVINEQGNVTSARAASGPPLLAGAAESAARGFKFTPITLDGVPVKSNRTVLFHFKE